MSVNPQTTSNKSAVQSSISDAEAFQATLAIRATSCENNAGPSDAAALRDLSAAMTAAIAKLQVISDTYNEVVAQNA